jgi:hypothetical protein
MIVVMQLLARRELVGLVSQWRQRFRLPQIVSWQLDAQFLPLVLRLRTAKSIQSASKQVGSKGKTMARKRSSILVGVAITTAAAAVLVFFGVRHWRPHWSVIQGAVIRSDSDVRKQSPLSDVAIVASDGSTSVSTQSDAAGYFKITFPGTVLPGTTVQLSLQHAGYKPVQLPETIRFRSNLRRLLVVAMPPVSSDAGMDITPASTVVSNIRVRYTVNSENEENVGSAVRTFEVVNQGNVPCRHQTPCSPGGYWKANSGAIQMDAGAGNEFHDARASCIAGPCPFTSIDSSGFAHGGRTITVSALDWSDPATFLVQAEVFHTAMASQVRESYPVEFGRGFNFTAPPTAEGPSLVAELGGVEIVFPLGADINLSWATCEERTQAKSSGSSVYQCELKAGYRF